MDVFVKKSEQQIITLLEQVNKSLVKAIQLMEFLVGEKKKK